MSESPEDSDNLPEPKRIRNIRREIAKAIPIFPNDKATRNVLEEKPLGALLIDYFNWRIRFVPPRSRQVHIDASVNSHPAWVAHHAEINDLLAKVRTGDDLTPYLSLKPHTRGYTPQSGALGASVEDRWSDKDFVLNTMGFHQFHVGAKTEAKGHIKRTDTLVFSYVNREIFRVVCVFSHDVFNSGTAERERLFGVHESIVSEGAPPASVIISSFIALSGHPVWIATMASRYARLISEYDAKFDDPSFVKELFKGSDREPPRSSRFEWYLVHLDLGFLEKESRGFFWLQKGPV